MTCKQATAYPSFVVFVVPARIVLFVLFVVFVVLYRIAIFVVPQSHVAKLRAMSYTSQEISPAQKETHPRLRSMWVSLYQKLLSTLLNLLTIL